MPIATSFKSVGLIGKISHCCGGPTNGYCDQYYSLGMAMTNNPMTVLFLSWCFRFSFVSVVFILLVHFKTRWLGKFPPKYLGSSDRSFISQTRVGTSFENSSICVKWWLESLWNKLIFCIHNVQGYHFLSCSPKYLKMVFLFVILY